MMTNSEPIQIEMVSLVGLPTTPLEYSGAKMIKMAESTIHPAAKRSHFKKTLSRMKNKKRETMKKNMDERTSGSISDSLKLSIRQLLLLAKHK